VFGFALLSLVPLFKHCALVIDASPIFRVSLPDLVEQNCSLYGHSRPNHQPCRAVYEPTWYESKVVLLSIVEDGVARVGSVSPSNAYVGVVLQG
jgi:hypothetical protein